MRLEADVTGSGPARGVAAHQVVSRWRGRGPAARRTAQGVVLVAAMIAALTAPLYLHGFHLTTATTAAVYCLFAYGVSVLYSYLGVINFGIGAFAAIGAYGMAVAGEREWPLLLAVAGGVLVPALLGAALAPLFFRMRGIYFALITFAFAILVKETAVSWDAVTAGTQGLAFVPTDGPVPGVAVSATHVYLATVVCVIVVAVAMWRLRHSRVGRRAIALGNDEPLAQSMGIRPGPYQLWLSAASGMLGGLGGVMLAFSTGYVVPETFGSPISLAAVTAVIVGGVALTAGPLAGAIILVFIPQFFELSPLGASVVYAILLIGTMLLAPGGLAVGLRDAARSVRVALGQRLGSGPAASGRHDEAAS